MSRRCSRFSPRLGVSDLRVVTAWASHFLPRVFGFFLCPRNKHLPSHFSPAVEELDPTENTDATAGVPTESLSFPFVSTEQDVVRIQTSGIADDAS